MQTSLESSQRGERLFLNSVRSPHSRRVYKFYFDKYLQIHGYKQASDLLARNQKEIETEIIEFIISSTEKGMKYAAILNYIKPVITFAKINDLMVNSKKINRYMPPNVKTKKTTAYITLVITLVILVILIHTLHTLHTGIQGGQSV